MPMTIVLSEKKKCPACQKSRQERPMLRLPRFAVYACACGVKYLDPSLDAMTKIVIYQDSASLSEINPVLQQYYEYQTKDPRSRTRKDYTRALAALAQGTGGRELCEMGCGTGGFLAYAKAAGWDVLGIDSSSENILKVRAQNLEAVQANILDYSVSRKFDGVVLWDLIEHMQDPAALLRKSRELLKPDGRLLIAVPYDPNLISLLALLLYRVTFGKLQAPVLRWYGIEHVSYFSKPGLTGLLERNDFQAVESWKTETDLARFRFGMVTQGVLRILFWIARFLGLQNRMVLIAKAK
jgi:2-polyprenyl-3-methyl-5-hydroxy-6-metoxy-1,4-benzoquinol methylase